MIYFYNINPLAELNMTEEIEQKVVYVSNFQLYM
jgi:hypothetical protein